MRDIDFMSIAEQAEEALKEQQSEQYMYEYSEVEKAVWINGYSRGVIAQMEKELKELEGLKKELEEPPNPFTMPDQIDSRFQG